MRTIVIELRRANYCPDRCSCWEHQYRSVWDVETLEAEMQERLSPPKKEDDKQCP